MRRPTHETCAALAAAIDAYIEKADSSLADLLKKAGYVHVDRTLEEANALEERLMRLMQGWMMDLIREWHNRGALDYYGILDAFLSRHPSAGAQDGINFIADVAVAFRDTFKNLMPLLVRSYSARIDDKLAVESITKRTTAFVDKWSVDLAQLMKLDSDKELKNILDRALRDGKGVVTAELDILHEGIRWPRWKARRVALTEMLRAHSYAQLDAYRQNPAVTGKRWMHTHAKFSTARPGHVALDGTVVPVDSTFNVGGYEAQCPRDTSLPPSESVNCHCLIQPVVDESILGLPLEERDRLWQEAVDADDRAWETEVDARKRLEALQYRGEDTTDAEAALAAALDVKSEQRKSTRFASSDLTPEQQAGLAERFAKGTQTARAVYDKYVPDGTAIKDAHHAPKRKGDPEAFFDCAQNGVYMDVYKDTKNPRDAWSTYFHEHGHYVDYNAGVPTRGYNRYVSQNTQEYIDALRADVKAREQAVKKKIGGRVGDARFEIGGELRQKGDVTHGVADIYGGVVGNFYPGAGWGHPARYWKTDRDATLAHEAFANMFEAQFDPEKMRLMEQYLPTSWAKFNEILRGLAHD